MTIRSILAMFLICWSANAAGQLSGHFYLEKSTFAPGEPIFLYFEVRNEGTKSENIDQADAYTFCSGYQIRVSNDARPESSCPSRGTVGSCLSGDVRLEPGKKKIERLLLNFDHKIDDAGEYSVDAARRLSHAGADVEYFAAAKDVLEVQETLYFQVGETAALDQSSLESWVNQLQSKDADKRREAARTLASIAPLSLQDTLLTFADVPEFRCFAPLAFHRLNTPRSMAALADLLRKASPGTYEHMESAHYLAASGDEQWFPLLRDVAQKNAQNLTYLEYAAELGGEKMLPTLNLLSRSPDKEFTRVNAVTAMGSTGSRAAVPIALAVLRDPDTSIADRARYALHLLTHRTASEDREASPQSEYEGWSRWWAREGVAAPIYKSTECGDLIPLPK